MKTKEPTVEDILQDADERISLAAKKRKVEKTKIERELRKIEEAEKNQAALDRLDVRQIPDEQIDRMDREHDLIVQSFSNFLPFVCPSLTDFVNFSYPSLFFVGAKSGQGKSTFAANAIYNLLYNDETKDRKVLLLTNEEMAINVYNRIICIHKGWNIDYARSFTQDQHNEIKAIRRKMVKKGQVRVVDSTYEHVKNATTSYEGLVTILENIYKSYIKQKEENPDIKPDYSLIVLDFYNKVNTSIVNPAEPAWSVLSKVSNYLDEFYKKYPAPVLVFGQLKPDKKDEEIDADGFEFRIKDSKSIFVPTTTALELRANKKERVTTVIIQKNRFGVNQGESIEIHQKNGKFIDFDPVYKAKIVADNSEREHQKALKNLTVKNK
jgi:hypothetical protein